MLRAKESILNHINAHYFGLYFEYDAILSQSLRKSFFTKSMRICHNLRIDSDSILKFYGRFQDRLGLIMVKYHIEIFDYRKLVYKASPYLVYSSVGYFKKFPILPPSNWAHIRIGQLINNVLPHGVPAYPL